jgi:anaerobic magnesium-protoporphyrin IX monomethyl ester cyclase
MTMADKPRILLFNPATWRGVGDTTAPWGLIALATHLTDVDVQLVDQRVDRGWRTNVEKALRQGPLLAGATAMTGVQLRHVLDFFALVKRVSPNVPTVLGGMHASILPVQTASHHLIDFVAVGESEDLIQSLVKTLRSGARPEDMADDDRFASLVWNGRTESVVHGIVPDLGKLANPPHHRFDMQRYVTETPNGRMLSVLTSRGCPHGCAFCIHSNPVLRRRWRGLGAERTVAFMRELAASYRVEHFHIQDDNFFVVPARVEELVSLFNDRPPSFTWTVGGAHVSHLKRYDAQFFTALRKAGCTRLLIGAESGSQQILKRIGKKQSTDDVLNVNMLLKRAEIRPIYSFISGVPGETDDDLLLTVELMDRLRCEGGGVDVGTIKPLIFYPGTKFYDWALANGFVPPRTVEGWIGMSWDHYLELPYPWLSQERKRFLIRLYYLSLLWNPDYHWVNSRLFSMVARILMPITRYRMTHLDFRGAMLPGVLRLLQHRALS